MWPVKFDNPDRHSLSKAEMRPLERHGLAQAYLAADHARNRFLVCPSRCLGVNADIADEVETRFGRGIDQCFEDKFCHFDNLHNFAAGVILREGQRAPSTRIYCTSSAGFAFSSSSDMARVHRPPTN